MPSEKIVRLWGAANYKPELKYLDRTHKAAQELLGEFNKWVVAGPHLILIDQAKHESLHVSATRCAFEALNPTDISTTYKRLSASVRKVLSGLDCTKTTRMGLKIVVYEDLGLTFEELKNQIRSFCLPKSSEFEKFTSSEILDVALNFDYKWNDFTVMFRTGPMKKKQGQDLLSSVGDIEKLMPAKEQSSELSQLYEKIPDSFWYFDVDIFADKENTIEKWHDFSEKTVPHILTVFENTKKTILECPV